MGVEAAQTPYLAFNAILATFFRITDAIELVQTGLLNSLMTIVQVRKLKVLALFRRLYWWMCNLPCNKTM